MKLTADVVKDAPRYTNALREREIDLRGNKFPVIENLGATADQFDVIDLSNNDIRQLDNFPLLRRLKSLLLSNNRVLRISSELAKSIPRLTTLVLTNNQVADFEQVQHLASLTRLELLSFVDNPVARLPHYRLFVIHTLPQLRILDFNKVRQYEREAAAKLFGGRSAEEIISSLGTAAAAPAGSTTANGHNAEEVRKIKEAITKAGSLEEVQRLERILIAGGSLDAPVPTRQAAAAADGEDEMEE